MRHKLKGRKLNRTSSHRKALLINLSVALLKHELIKTTLPKAKELRPYVEKLMTTAKVDNLANRRKVLAVIKDQDLVNKLFTDIASRIKSRNGGYTRIMHFGFRTGDKAPMAVIELVDRVAKDITEKKAANDSKKSTAKKAKTETKKAVVKKDTKPVTKKTEVKTEAKAEAKTKTAVTTDSKK